MKATSTDRELLDVEFELYHPICWSSPVAAETGALLLGHGPAVSGDIATERCTVYGDSPRHIDGAIETARDSPLVRTLREVESSTRHPVCVLAEEYSHARDVFAEQETSCSIGAAFADRGFLQNGPSHVGGKTETWQLLTHVDRSREDMGEQTTGCYLCRNE